MIKSLLGRTKRVQVQQDFTGIAPYTKKPLEDTLIDKESKVKDTGKKTKSSLLNKLKNPFKEPQIGFSAGTRRPRYKSIKIKRRRTRGKTKRNY